MSKFEEGGTILFPNFSYTDIDGDKLTIEVSGRDGELVMNMLSSPGAVMVNAEDREEFEKRLRELKSKTPCDRCNGKGHVDG